MMNFPSYKPVRPSANPWEAQVAQQQTLVPQQQPMDYDGMPYDFQGGETTTDPTQYDTGGGDVYGDEEDYMTFQLPQTMRGGGGGGGGWEDLTGAVNFADFDVASMKELFPELMLKDINDQAMEQAGLGGTRWSSVLGQKIADANARAEKQWAADMFAKWIASQEAAKQRGLSHREAAAGRGLQRSMFETRLPMEVAAMMANLGGQAQEAEMQPWGVAYEDWLRTTPEAAMGTYGNTLVGMLGQEPGGPTQYEPGWASGLMGIGSALLPFAGGASPGKLNLAGTATGGAGAGAYY